MRSLPSGGFNRFSPCENDCGYVDTLHSEGNRRVRRWSAAWATIWEGSALNNGGQHVESSVNCQVVFYHLDAAANELKQYDRDVQTGEDGAVNWTAEALSTTLFGLGARPTGIQTYQSYNNSVVTIVDWAGEAGTSLAGNSGQVVQERQFGTGTIDAETPLKIFGWQGVPVQEGEPNVVGDLRKLDDLYGIMSGNYVALLGIENNPFTGLPAPLDKRFTVIAGKFFATGSELSLAVGTGGPGSTFAINGGSVYGSLGGERQQAPPEYNLARSPNFNPDGFVRMDPGEGINQLTGGPCSVHCGRIYSTPVGDDATGENNPPGPRLASGATGLQSTPKQWKECTRYDPATGAYDLLPMSSTPWTPGNNRESIYVVKDTHDRLDCEQDCGDSSASEGEPACCTQTNIFVQGQATQVIDNDTALINCGGFGAAAVRVNVFATLSPACPDDCIHSMTVQVVQGSFCAETDLGPGSNCRTWEWVALALGIQSEFGAELRVRVETTAGCVEMVTLTYEPGS